MRLEIEQQMAQINIEIQQAQLHVEMPKRQMEINYERPEMTPNREKAKVELDLDDFKANMGLKSYNQLTAEAAAKAHAEAQQGIREIVNQSKYISDVTIPGNKVAIAAKGKMLEYQDPSMGHSPVPSGAVKMDGKPGKLEIEWTGYELTVDWTGDCMPEIYVEPPSSVIVEISTRPEVKVTVSEIYIPKSAGRNLNTEV